VIYHSSSDADAQGIGKFHFPGCDGNHLEKAGPVSFVRLMFEQLSRRLEEAMKKLRG